MSKQKQGKVLNASLASEEDKYTASITPELIQAVHSSCSQSQLKAIRKVRKLLSRDGNPPIEDVVQAGILPRFVELLKTGNNTLQLEAAWALCNIASGTSEQTRMVIEAGAVPVLLSLLSSEYDDVLEQAVWALGNIAGDSADSRDYLLACGMLKPLLQLLDPPIKQSESITRYAVWSLSNLCRGKNPPPDPAKVTQCLPVLAKLLNHKDKDVLVDSCWALSYLSDGPNDRIEAVINSGVCPRLVELLRHDELKVVSAALRTLGHIATGTNRQTQVIIQSSVLPCLKILSSSPVIEQDRLSNAIRKDAVWTVSNIAAGNNQQIQSVIDADIFPVVIERLKNAEVEIRKEAAYAIANTTHCGTADQIRYLVEQGCIPPICELLTLTDKNIIQVALTALENILMFGEETARDHGFNIYAASIEECNGLNKIESLQWQASMAVRQDYIIFEQASYIVSRYFNSTDYPFIMIEQNH